MTPPSFEALERHTSVALSFSGGKDGLACVYMLRDRLHELTVYHMDTGDLLPEMMEVVEHVKRFAPNFVHLRQDVTAWIEENGLPTDLLPHSAHTVGYAMGELSHKLVSRYNCCFTNLMAPTYQRVVKDGNTLMIRGTKRVDMATLPLRSGDVTIDGVELLYPLQEWTDADVFAYLRRVGAPISRVYDHAVKSPECARCSAWWGEGRNAYLKKYHPSLWLEYRARLKIIRNAIDGPLENLRKEEVLDA